MSEITLPVPMTIDGAFVDTLEIIPITFADFGRIYADTRADQSGSFAARWNRHRMLHQIRHGGGKRLDPLALLTMPIRTSRAVLAALSAGDGQPGEVITPGNGVDTPIVYRLGAPIAATTDGEAAPFTELEFSASTYGQVEEVLAGETEIDQTLALIRSVAVPPGMMALPSWAADRIGVADGLEIMSKVLPSFLA